MTDKQCSSCGGFCGKVCERENVVEPYNGWVLRKVYFEDGEPLMHSEPESQALEEPPNSTTNVVEPETEEPLTLKEQREAQQQLENHLDAVYQRNNQAFLEQAQLGQSENTQSQELYGKTEQLEAEIKRLQELADYRLKLLTKMPSEWVGLTVEEVGELTVFDGLHDVEIPLLADFIRAIEAKLKEKNA